MRGIPILKSKLKMPQLPPVVAGTKRLQGLCGEMIKQQLVVIHAPAGYGKSTLMVAALHKFREKGARICWYRLGEEDRAPAVFYTHLVEGLLPEAEGLGEELRAYLATCSDIAAQHRYVNALICQELWALHQIQPALKTIIAFDDFQQIQGTPDLYDDILFLVDNLPDNCSVLVGSRAETGFLTAKRRLSKNTLEITSRELSFSSEETAVLLKQRGLQKLEAGLLPKIMQHTEGWPAGIVLFCQLLNDGAVDAKTVLNWPGRQELFFQYMATEVLKATEPHLLAFLVKAAIFSEVGAAEAAAVFAEGKVTELMEACYKKGLFLQKIAGTGNAETIYRFHSLFRDALLQVQPLHLTAEEVNSYHLQAAVYNMERKVFDRAIKHFIACGNVVLAVELVTRESVHLIAFEAVEELRLWFRLLPEEVVSNNGYLLFIKSFINRRGVDDALQLLEQALALFRQGKDGAMQFFTLVAISNLKVQRSDVGALKKIHVQLGELAQTLQGQPFHDMLAVFAFITAVWEEKLSRGVSLLRIIEEISLPGEWHWLKLFYASQLYYLRGDLDTAERIILEALELEMVRKSELMRGCTLLAYAHVLQITDQQERHSLAVSEMTAIGERNGYLLLTASGKRQEAFAAYCRHDLEQALELVDASADYFKELKNPAMASSNFLYRTLWLCRQQPPATLLPWAQKALKTLAASPCGQGLQEIGMSLFGAIAREAGEYELAEQSLERALRRSRAKGSLQITAGICIHLARLYFETSRQAGGDELLMQGFGLAAANRYVSFWDMHFPTLVEMAARCVRGGIHADFALGLIARYYGSEAAEFLYKGATVTPPEQLREFTDVFISRYGLQRETQTSKIHVNLFGSFGIALNGVAIPDREWKTKKVAGILKYLLLQRNRAVAKDRLMEEFWPDVDKKHASLSLRAAQHELKKVLRQYGLTVDNEALFLNEKRDSLGVRSGNMLEVDVDLFLACDRDLKSLPTHEGTAERKKPILEKMLALYQGDLLEEELYDDWVFAEREELKSIYFSSSMELAHIYGEEGAGREAEKLFLKILAMDPFSEEACLNLLRLYMATNQKGRAARLYTKFVQRFEKELQLKPDQRLSEVLQDKA